MIMLNSSKADVTVIHICASCLKTTLNILSHLCQELTELFSFSLPQIQRTFDVLQRNSLMETLLLKYQHLNGRHVALLL